MKLKRNSYAWVAVDYAKKVTSGKVEACWQVKAACHRMLDDLERVDLRFDVARIDHVCAFAEALPHVIGPLAGENIRLEPFQVFIFANLFGFVVKETDLRRYREAFILLPRGNAKSTIAAIIGLYMSFCEGEGGAQGMSGATSLAQAEAVFIPARRMVEMTPALAEDLGLEAGQRAITQLSSGSNFRPVIAKTKDGGLPFIAIADELHQAVNGVQLSAFRTGMGKRRGSDPMLIIISTAGTNLAGVCRQEQLYFESVLAKTFNDDSKFALIYTIDPKDDWKDFKVWRKANPNFGVSVDEDHLRREYDKALQSPAAQADALTKYLNVWVNSATGWLNNKDWQSAAKSDLLLSSLPTGTRCFIGVDMSTKTDLTAVTLVAILPDGSRAIFPFLFLPEGAIDRSPRNASAYKEWIATGDLIRTDGSASDHQEVENKIRELCEKFNVENVCFDVFQAAGMMQRLQADGIPVSEFAQKAINFNQPMVDFEADLLNGKIQHTDNACLNWMAQNISVSYRGPLRTAGKPTGQPHLKIDGMIAMLMAYAASTEAPAPPAAPMLWFA